jgi:hypothetical protein
LIKGGLFVASRGNDLANTAAHVASIMVALLFRQWAPTQGVQPAVRCDPKRGVRPERRLERPKMFLCELALRAVGRRQRAGEPATSAIQMT